MGVTRRQLAGPHHPGSCTMKTSFLLLLVMLSLVILTRAGRRQAFTPYMSPGQLFGSVAPAPCCRSGFPEEYGSCLANEHCLQPTAPFCSAFGFCTQQKQYGYNGCVACPQRSPGRR